jgi:hypothetical protein
MADPVLNALSAGQLKLKMPFAREEHRLQFERDNNHVMYLEAFGRMLAGLAPWLELNGLSGEEKELQTKYRELARASLDAGTDPSSPDFFMWSNGADFEPYQSLVDAAFLALGLLHAPAQLFEKLEERVKDNLHRRLKTVSKIRPAYFNNWILFSAMVETALCVFYDDGDYGKIESHLLRSAGWYLGGGLYGDGETYAWDYYNSYVIQPMLERISFYCEDKLKFYGNGKKIREQAVESIKKYCVQQERAIAPDGSYMAYGRSVVYRLGAFHALSHCAFKKLLPDRLPPAQVRRALTKAIQKFAEGKNYDENGWLLVGVYGSQPNLTEPYISTGSLYMASLAFMPLGLSAGDEFWASEDELTSWEKYWTGADIASDGRYH